MAHGLEANVMGYAAAVLGSAMFLPQLVKMYRNKDVRSVSLFSTILLTIVSVLWTGYGILLSAPPVIAVNTIVGLSAASMTALKLRYDGYSSLETDLLNPSSSESA